MKVVLFCNKYLLFAISLYLFINNLLFIILILMLAISYFYVIIFMKGKITMDKNYYEILEIDRNASPEIIDKAYKTLAKKYHPDLQDEAHKKESEEKFKIINEAYQVLSNPEQKDLYDQKLVDSSISQDQYEEMYRQNQILKDKLNNLQQQRK